MKVAQRVRESKTAMSAKRMWINLLFGFSAGLPIMIVFSVVKIWARREGVDLGTIGLMGIVALPYSLNFLAGPLLDGPRCAGPPCDRCPPRRDLRTPSASSAVADARARLQFAKRRPKHGETLWGSDQNKQIQR